MPDEVRPLVEGVNALLAARAEEIERSCHRAADLAHGLKTPLAALAADAGRLREAGQPAVADGIDEVIATMRRHVDRELARVRLRGSGRSQPDASTALASLVRSLVATLARTPDGVRIAYEIAVTDEVTAPFDRSDLAEALGNLLENATRHARGQIRLAAAADGRRISVEDDGAGIPEAARPMVLARGGRLDERGGAGLGLAIVQDVVEAYGWILQLDGSELGGLRATIEPRLDRSDRSASVERERSRPATTYAGALPNIAGSSRLMVSLHRRHSFTGPAPVPWRDCARYSLRRMMLTTSPAPASPAGTTEPQGVTAGIAVDLLASRRGDLLATHRRSAYRRCCTSLRRWRRRGQGRLAAASRR